MPVALPYSPFRRHSEPVAEVSGVVANHKGMRIDTSMGASSLKRSTSAAKLLSAGLQHERALEMLRCVLAAATALAEEAQEEERRWDVALAAKRAVFVEGLRAQQHPQAETISTTAMLLHNRVRLGLVSAESAAAYAEAEGEGVGLALAGSVEPSPASSLDSMGTLGGSEPAEPVAAWAGGGRWGGARRGRSIASDRTLAGDAALEPDELGVCWPVAGGGAREAPRFDAELGAVRVPPRFRVPQHSLAMLAGEQRMMRSDKIVCPLKNRLQEVNPRRQGFEDVVRATGAIPAPPAAQPSPLRRAC
ncbi:hypothetical protein EV183_002394 [Coemansia sp. RSA 2336]|nr:hypothetical protein EV183_002394 [Coemansia sp. RSA 2336]